VLLHLRKELAEYNGEDDTGRKRHQPSGLNHMLRDVRSFSYSLFTTTQACAARTRINRHQGLAYLQTADYQVSALTTTHPTRPMTLYKGPHSLFRALAPKYRLNKAEYLQLYNLRPSTQVMLELVIEEVRSPSQRSCSPAFCVEDVALIDDGRLARASPRKNSSTFWAYATACSTRKRPRSQTAWRR
jgi:hypothetical protein